MYRLLLSCLVLGLVLTGPAAASTYNEPWQEEVVRDSHALVKLEVVSVKKMSVVRFRLLKHLAGEEVPEKGRIVAFTRAPLIPVAGRGIYFSFPDGMVGYFLLQRTEDGNWSIPTPSAGWADVKDGKVVATFRHSYHKTLVSEDVYELVMSAMFNQLHEEPYDQEAVLTFIDGWLAKGPADPPAPDEEDETFFNQHVALEALRFFGRESDLPRLEPFLTHDHPHVQISAVRSLAGIDTPASHERLLTFLADPTREPFAQVMAVWGLERLDARHCADRLRELMPTASTSPTGFGGDIMDPRVGTAFPPSVQAAIKELLARW